MGEDAADSTGEGRAAAGLAKEGFAAAALGCDCVCAVGKLAADEALEEALDEAATAADAAAGWEAAGSTSAFAGALLVFRSTVTFRSGSGADAGRVGAGPAFGFGPDNNSGTTSTTSATKIDAPISRSLTRRSITVKYIRDAPPPAAILRIRANRLPVPRYERIRTRRFDPVVPPHLRPQHRRSRRCPRR